MKTFAYTSREDIIQSFSISDKIGVGEEALTIQEYIEEAINHFLIPISRREESPIDKFYRLKNEWIEETKFLSSISEIVIHPAYQKIIGMGKTAMPFIIRDLQESSNHWFWALKAITDEDPVPASMRGKIKEMTIEWLKWWSNNEDII